MQLVTSTKQVLGSTITIQVATNSVKSAKAAIAQSFRECVRIEKAYSRFLENNALATLNANLTKWQAVSSELYFLISFGLELGKNSDGAFNLSVKELLEQWGYDASYSLTPRPFLNVSADATTAKKQAIKIKAPNLVYTAKQLDLGGIGKGYALDQIVSTLKDFPNLFVNAGGDLFVRGLNEQSLPWTVYFEHPLDSAQVIGEISVSEPLFFGASNPGKRRWPGAHHLLDPFTQAPAQNMLAVYTQGTSGLLVDGWATALFAMGFATAESRLESLPVDALIISPNGQMLKSQNFKIDFYTQ